MVVRKMGGNIEAEIRRAIASDDVELKDAVLGVALAHIARLKGEVGTTSVPEKLEEGEG